MTLIKSHRDLVVWQKAFKLSLLVYSLTKSFPPEERYGLTSQMRRAAISIPSNIAEGKNRESIKEFVQFLLIAFGSCSELETQIDISKELTFIDKNDYNRCMDLVYEVSKMLNSLIHKLETSN